MTMQRSSQDRDKERELDELCAEIDQHFVAKGRLSVETERHLRDLAYDWLLHARDWELPRPCGVSTRLRYGTG